MSNIGIASRQRSTFVARLRLWLLLHAVLPVTVFAGMMKIAGGDPSSRYAGNAVRDSDTVSSTAVTISGQAAAYRGDTRILAANIPAKPNIKPDGPVHVTGAVIEAKSSNKDQLILALDGPVIDNIFILTEPDRIVIDLENTLGDGFINGLRLSSNLVQLVRGGAHENNQLRVVLDLKGPAWADSSLRGPDADGKYHLLINVNRIPLATNIPKTQEPSPPAAGDKPLSGDDRNQLGLKLSKNIKNNQEPSPPVGGVNPSYDSDRNRLQLKLAKNIRRPWLPASGIKPSYSNDQIQLDLNYDRSPLGSIDAIEYSGGYMLALGQLIEVLGFPVQVSAQDGLANGWFIRKNRIFVLDVNKGKAIIDGKEKAVPSDLVQVRNQEIYVDSSLLEHFFPIHFVIDPSALSLTLAPDPNLPATEREQMVNQWLKETGSSRELVSAPPPLPAAAPAAPATEKQKETARQAAAEKPGLPAEQAGRAEVPPLKSAHALVKGLTEENVVILQPFIDDKVVDEYIEAYQVGERYLLPLQDLADILHFAIQVDASAGRAHGWFLSEDHTFNLDLAAGTITAGEVKDTIPANMIFATGTDLYVDSKVLSHWLPLNFKVDLTALTLAIHPREPLPFQLREKRLRAWKRLQYRKQEENKDYDTVTLPYQLATLPFIDLNLGQQFTNKGTDHSISSYSLLASGDLGYMNTNIFSYGDSVGPMVDDLRIESGRKSDTPSLLGPLRATEYELGDITSMTIPLVAQSSYGRGFSVTNKSIFRASEFDSTNFIGDATPDWDVELYRNGALIDSQVVGTDGRYEFLQVPILYGNNTFQLIFHGPEGQIREEVKRFNIGDALLSKGEFNYEFSMDQKSQPLFDVGTPEIINHPKEFRIGGDLEYGLTKSLTGTVGMFSTPLEDGMHRYLTGGLRSTWGGFLGSLDTAWDQSTNGWAARGAVYGQLWNVNLKAEQSVFRNFVSEIRLDINQVLTNRTQLGVNGIFSLPYIEDLNFNLDVDREEFQSGLSRTQIKNRLAKSVLGWRFTNTLDYTLTGPYSTSIDELALRGYYKGILIRANLDYEVAPRLRPQQFQISAQKRIFNDVTARAVLMQSIVDSRNTILSASLNWEKKLYRFSLRADVDSNQKFTIGGNLIFSFGRIPGSGEWVVQSDTMAGRGGVIPRAYLDKNLDSRFDAGDEVLDNARFRVQKKRVTPNNGVALAMGLAPNRYTDVEIDKSGLDDPLWIPTVEGYKFIPRPGIVAHVDFPVVETSQIDGFTYLSEDGKDKRPLGRISLELVNAGNGKVVKKFRSEYDGYFLIDKALPGHYFIRVSAIDLTRLHLQEQQKPELTVTGESDIYNGYDITLKKIQKM